MASATRTKTPQRGSKQKPGRRMPPKVKTGPDIPLLPVVVGAILLVLAAGIGVVAYMNNRPSAAPQTVAGIPCDQLEHTQVHYHAALQIIHEGVLTPIPASIGIVTNSSGQVTCYYWLHVHGQYPDVVHIESPANQTFTLGQFFSVWNTWSKGNGGPSQPLNSTHVSTFTLSPGEKLYVYIDANDGKGPQRFSGDPNSIVLKSHEVISLEISTGTPTTPPAFDWNSTTNSAL